METDVGHSRVGLRYPLQRREIVEVLKQAGTLALPPDNNMPIEVVIDSWQQPSGVTVLSFAPTGSELARYTVFGAAPGWLK